MTYEKKLNVQILPARMPRPVMMKQKEIYRTAMVANIPPPIHQGPIMQCYHCRHGKRRTCTLGSHKDHCPGRVRQSHQFLGRCSSLRRFSSTSESLILCNTIHTGPVHGLDFNPIQTNLLSSGAVSGEVSANCFHVTCHHITST